MNRDGFPGGRFHPAAKHATARKDKCVLSAGIDHRQLQIAIKRRGCYGLPFHLEMIRRSCAACLILINPARSPKRVLRVANLG
jgi:hypothetical protein